MSVQSEVDRISHIGNASNTDSYVVPFNFFEDSDLVVVVTDQYGAELKLDQGSDYAVSGAGDPAGGGLVTAVAVPATSKVTIYREILPVQTMSYQEADAFPAKSHERALDRLTMLCQRVIRAGRRAFRVRESDGDMNEVAAAPNTVVGFGGSKQPRTYTASEMAVWLNLTQQFFGEGTKTWLTEADRAFAVPDFLGQVGVQLGDFSLWVADGIAAGDWSDPTPGIEDGSISTAKLATGILSADSLGRAKVAAGFFDVGSRGKFANSFVNLALLDTDAKVFASRVSGLKVASTGNSTLTIDVSEIVLPNGSGGYMRYNTPSTQTVDITATGANGLDTGSEVSATWYYIWAISDGSNFRGLLSASSTAPTMPSGYSYKLIIGAVRNNGSSNFVSFFQIGKQVSTVEQNVFTAQTGVTTYTSVSLANFVPPTAATVTGIVGTSSNVDKKIALASSADAIAVIQFSINGPSPQFEGTYGMDLYANLPLITAQTIYWKGGDTASGYRLSVTGYSFNF